MGLFPQQFIDDLRLQANILQVVQEYVPLKRAGTSYKGLCPFHNEKTPSFHVHPDKGFFHCFGCGVGGDVFKFLELHEKVGFQDAVRMLAQKFGVAIPEAEGTSDEARRDSALREALLKAHEVAARLLPRAARGAGRRAGARRSSPSGSVTPQTIEQLGLGFAPSARDGLKARLLAQGFAQGLLLQSGLVVQRESGEVVDRFRNRLMVPICRDTGSVIAFGGRQMDPDQGGPKYLNSPETPIYSKSRTLYGLHLTKAQIRKVGFAVLVEGYFDFAQVFQSRGGAGGRLVRHGADAAAGAAAAAIHVEDRAELRSRTRPARARRRDRASCSSPKASTSTSSCWTRAKIPIRSSRRKGGDEYRARLRTSRPYLEYLLDQAAEGAGFRARRQPPAVSRARC